MLDIHQLIFAVFAGGLFGWLAFELGCSSRRTLLLLVVAYALAMIMVALDRAIDGDDILHSGAAIGSWAERAVIALAAYAVARWRER